MHSDLRQVLSNNHDGQYLGSDGKPNWDSFIKVCQEVGQVVLFERRPSSGEADVEACNQFVLGLVVEFRDFQDRTPEQIIHVLDRLIDHLPASK